MSARGMRASDGRKASAVMSAAGARKSSVAEAAPKSFVSASVSASATSGKAMRPMSACRLPRSAMAR